MQTFQELVAAQKAARGLTDSHLGALLGVSQQTASEWVGGRRIPEIERAAGIAAALNLTEDEVATAISYARRKRAGTVEEAMAILSVAGQDGCPLSSSRARVRSAGVVCA